MFLSLLILQETERVQRKSQFSTATRIIRSGREKLPNRPPKPSMVTTGVPCGHLGVPCLVCPTVTAPDKCSCPPPRPRPQYPKKRKKLWGKRRKRRKNGQKAETPWIPVLQLISETAPFSTGAGPQGPRRQENTPPLAAYWACPACPTAHLPGIRKTREEEEEEAGRQGPRPL
jgi:hypothetical protein